MQTVTSFFTGKSNGIESLSDEILIIKHRLTSVREIEKADQDAISAS